MTATLRGRSGAPADPPVPNPRRRLPLLIAALVLLLVGVLAWVVAFSPVLGARTVAVRGNRAVTADQVRAAARVGHGTPLLRVDAGAIAGRVEALPDVAQARVTVSYPSTVVITVIERTAVGYLARGTSAVLVDRTGRQYRTVAAAPATLPRFDLPAGPAAEPTGRAVAVVAAALPRSVLTELSSIQAISPTSITLVLRDRRSVFWGSADGSPDKARILPALLAREGTFFDVSNPDLVYTR